jgi:AcrR family transcriptional regulator
MPPKRKKRGYHHPDLRTALLDAAAHMIKQDGVAGFSLRELAKQAGVSHTAPYRHFKNKEEILANLMLEGHRRLRAFMLAARDVHPASAAEQIGDLSRAYLDFARANPEYLHVMFSRAGMEAAMALEASQNFKHDDIDTFGVLEATIKDCQAEGTLDPDVDSGALSMHAWASVHGLALLANEGMIAILAGQRGMDEASALEEIFAISRSRLRRPAKT